MKKAFVTIVGMDHKFRAGIIEVGDTVKLTRESGNEKDMEAVAVKYGEKVVGYVANSVKTNVRGCCSAGNICEWVAEEGNEATVILKLEDERAIAEVNFGG